MSEFILVDAGNTRVKWCIADSSGSQSGLSFLATQDVLSDSGCSLLVDKLAGLASFHGITSVLACHVLGAPWADRFSSQLAERAIQVRFPVQGTAALLGTLYSDPLQLGQDRWLGCLAVASMSSAPLNLVASFGTATTVDAVVSSKLVDELAERDWLHLGGVIYPGVGTMFDSLNQNTRQLPVATLSSSDWPVSTLDALGAGVLLAQASPITGLIQRLCSIQSKAPLKLWVSGGYSTDIMMHSHAEHEHVESLVFSGLLAMAREAQ